MPKLFGTLDIQSLQKTQLIQKIGLLALGVLSRLKED